jgi:CDP-6-deoxy-D-xylo-4-hexulose-3-dehydrase
LDSNEKRIGEVVLLDFPYTNRHGSKVRPALIVGISDIQNDLLVAYVTSEVENYIWSDYAVKFCQTDLQKGTVKQESIIRCDKIITIDPKRIVRSQVAFLKKIKAAEVLRKISMISVNGFYGTIHQKETFSPGKSRINYAGRVFDEKEIANAVEASLDFWLTEGRFSENFAEKISEFLGVMHVMLTNSGSSANLLAFAALTSEKLGERRLKPGDEVISVAAGFPATVAPIIQYGLVPVFVDVMIPTYNIDIEMLSGAITPKTSCIFLAHTLGNPFDIDAVMQIARENDLWVIEDNCDAFGSEYKGRKTGTFGHLSTISFYPAHHITTGEGGAVCTNDPQLATIVKSFRDWGRDCYCAGGENNTCGKRFSQQFGDLPLGFDHKYVYSEIGYNLKMTDIQAAIGAAQMDKLPAFCQKRKDNFREWYCIFSKYPEFFILPEATEDSDPAWFAFIVTLKEGAPFTRDELTRHLNENLIETRNLFAGNITKQPGYLRQNFRIASHLNNTDYIMNNTFFLGTYPGLTKVMTDYTEGVLCSFITGKSNDN